MQPSSRDPIPAAEPEDRRIGWTSRLLGGSFALLVLAVVAGAIARPDLLDRVIAGLLAVVGCVAVVHARTLAAREARRRAEAESVSRLLRGLARSVSPDAIVAAIAGELAPVAEADHVVVVRLRGDPARLDATLVSTRPGIPSSTTQLPISDLEDPGEDRRRTAGLRPVSVVAGVAPGATPVIALDLATRRSGGSLAAAVGALRSLSAVGRPGVAVPAASPHRTTADGAVPARLAEGRTPGPRGRRDPGRAERIAAHLADRVGSAYALRNTLAAPLVVDGSVTGALVLSRRAAGPWPESSRRRLAEAAAEASVALDRARSHHAAEARASTDALTGLPNRRYFDEFCGLLARRRRSGDAVGVLMADIDRFKQLNDRHGHAAGDEVLRAVAGAIGAAVREDDVPARYGGEEFVVLLREPSRDVAVEIGERVRRAVGAIDLRAAGLPRVTVSVGVAVQRAPGEPVGELVERADQALYRAKRAGRDRVVTG